MLTFICVLVLFCWAIGRLATKLEGNGALKDAAKLGFVNMMSRWTK